MTRKQVVSAKTSKDGKTGGKSNANNKDSFGNHNQIEIKSF
jgi:hypothetical protein